MLTETLEARQLLAAGDAVQLVDDADADFSTTGTFNPNSGGFNSGIKQSHFNWTASTASWTFDVSPGTYEVAASWPGKSNSASDAPFSVLDGVGGSVLGTVSMDQTAEPDDFVDENVGWESLGSFTVTGNSIEVQLSNAVTAGYAIADVVRIQRVAPVSLSEAQLGAVADKAHVGFGITGVGQLVDKAFTLTNDSAAAITLDPIVAPQGFSIVNNFTAGQTLSAGASVNFTVRLDASAASKSYGPLSIVVDDGAESLLELTISGTTLAAGSAVQVVDDSDVGFYHSGTFYSISGGGLNGAMQHSHPSWRDSLARWVVDVEPGTYEVAATWPSSSARAIDAPFTIYDGVGGSVLATSVVDQTDAPREFVEAGTAWDSLGEVTATGNTLVIEVSNDSTTGYSIADAVRVQRLAGVSVSEATLGNVAQGDHVGFGVTEVGSPVEKTFTLSNDSADPVLLAPITAATGFTVVNNFQSSQSLPAGQTIDFTVRLDAGADAKSFGRLEMVIEDDAAALFDFGISGTVTSSAVQEVGRFDDGFVSAGKFQMVAVGHFGSAMKTHVSYEGSRVYWVVDVQPGEYEVAVSWPGFSGNAPDAPFTVYDGVGGAALETIAVDQTGDANDFVDGLTGWKVLGDYTITGNTLMIDVTNAIASGFAVADAVRVQRLSGVSVTDAFGVPIGNGKHFGFGAVEEGRIVSKTFTLSNDGGDSIELSPVAVPAGFTVVNNFTAGQVLSAGSSVDFTVQFDGTTETKAYGELSIEIDAGGPSLFWSTISGTSLAAPGTLQYLDNDETGFLKAGFFTTGAGAYGTDQNHALASWQGSRAIWVFDVQPGTYRVAATWLPASIYAPNTPFTVYDGVEGEPLGTTTFDQTIAPDDLSDAGVDWELILGEFDITGNTLMVNLTNVVANGYAAADAIRIERIEDPPGDQLDQAKVVSLQPNVPAEVTATIGNGLYGEADVDLFAVDLTAGQILKADVDAFYLDDGTWGSLLDSYLQVFDASGTELAAADVGSAAGDVANDLDAYLSVTAPVTGTYYVGVTGSGNTNYDPNLQGTGTAASTGDYTLQLLATDTATTPTLSGLADLTIDENSGSHNVTFTVGDPDTPLDELTTRYISSDAALVAVPSGTQTGTGGSRTVSITAIDGYYGTATITVIVSDGTESISDTFAVTVDQLNVASEITDVTLVHDSGTPDDLSTAIAAVEGRVRRRADEQGFLVEFDHDGDGIAEGTAAVDPATLRFSYDPTQVDSNFTATTGATQLHHRLVLQRSGLPDLFTDWQSFDFSIEAAPSSPLSADNVTVDVYQTSTTSHGLTYLGEIIGEENLGESVASNVVVEVDTDGDLQSDDSVAVIDLADGFAYTPASANFASHTISFRIVHDDSFYQTQRAGSWNSLVFDPAETPSIASVALREDTGFSSTDGVTADPTIVGTLSGTLHDATGIVVEMDIDGDDIVDLTTTVDSAGAFGFAPYPFAAGTVDVKVRAAEGVEVGEWVDFSFDYQPHDVPSLSSIGLLIDDGELDDDNVTTVATLTGTFATRFGDPQRVEFDTDGDGSADVTVDAVDGLFTFDVPNPVEGTNTVDYRATRDNPYLAAVEYGSWETFTFEYELREAELATFGSVGLAVVLIEGGTGTETSDPTIVGDVEADGPVTVLVDLDGDGVTDDSFVTEPSGAFSYTPTGLSLGQKTITLRTWSYDYLNQTMAEGAPETIAFELVAPSNDPPTSSLSLLSDSGVDGDGITENPSIIGTVSSDGFVGGLTVEIDSSGDLVADEIVRTDENGQFLFSPTIDAYGTVTLSARALSPDAQSAGYLVGAWETITFQYVDQVDAPPVLADLFLIEPDTTLGISNGQLDQLIGRVTNEGSVEDVFIEVDLDDDAAADYSGTTDRFGRFSVGLAGLNAGTVTLKVRASEQDPVTKQFDVGSWESHSFSYLGADPLSVTIDSIDLINDTGVSGDGITTDPRIGGTATSTAAGTIGISFDHDGDGQYDGFEIAADNGDWTYVPRLNTGGLQTVYATPVLIVDGEIELVGQTAELDLDFTLSSDPALELTDLALQFDTGDLTGDGITSNPAIEGTFAADETGVAYTLEVDHDGDGVTDGSQSLAAGTFGYDPIGLPTGWNTLHLRAVSDGGDVGAWTSISFGLFADANSQAATSIGSAASSLATRRSESDVLQFASQQTRSQHSQSTLGTNTTLAQGIHSANASLITGLSTAATNFTASIGSFAGNTASFDHSLYQWPDAPIADRFVGPSPDDQPPLPVPRPTFDGPDYDFESDPIYQADIALAETLFNQEKANAEQDRGDRDQTAEQLYQQRIATADDQYNTDYAALLDRYYKDNPLNATVPGASPPVIPHWESLERIEAVKDADVDDEEQRFITTEVQWRQTWTGPNEELERRIEALRHRTALQILAHVDTYVRDAETLDYTDQLASFAALYTKDRELALVVKQKTVAYADAEKEKAYSNSASKQTEANEIAQARADLWNARATAKADALDRWNLALDTNWTDYQKSLADQEKATTATTSSLFVANTITLEDARRTRDDAIADARHLETTEDADALYHRLTDRANANEIYAVEATHAEHRSDVHLNSTQAVLARRLEQNFHAGQNAYQYPVLYNFVEEIVPESAAANFLLAADETDIRSVMAGAFVPVKVEYEKVADADRDLQQSLAQAERDYQMEEVRIDGQLERQISDAQTTFTQTVEPVNAAYQVALQTPHSSELISAAQAYNTFVTSEANDYQAAIAAWDAQVDLPWSEFQLAIAGSYVDWATDAGLAEVAFATTMSAAYNTNVQQSTDAIKVHNTSLATAENSRIHVVADESDNYATLASDANLAFVDNITQPIDDFYQAVLDSYERQYNDNLSLTHPLGGDGGAPRTYWYDRHRAHASGIARSLDQTIHPDDNYQMFVADIVDSNRQFLDTTSISIGQSFSEAQEIGPSGRKRIQDAAVTLVQAREIQQGQLVSVSDSARQAFITELVLQDRSILTATQTQTVTLDEKIADADAAFELARSAAEAVRDEALARAEHDKQVAATNAGLILEADWMADFVLQKQQAAAIDPSLSQYEHAVALADQQFLTDTSLARGNHQHTLAAEALDEQLAGIDERLQQNNAITNAEKAYEKETAVVRADYNAAIATAEIDLFESLSPATAYWKDAAIDYEAYRVALENVSADYYSDILSYVQSSAGIVENLLTSEVTNTPADYLGIGEDISVDLYRGVLGPGSSYRAENWFRDLQIQANPSGNEQITIGAGYGSYIISVDVDLSTAAGALAGVTPSWDGIQQTLYDAVLTEMVPYITDRIDAFGNISDDINTARAAYAADIGLANENYVRDMGLKDAAVIHSIATANKDHEHNTAIASYDHVAAVSAADVALVLAEANADITRATSVATAITTYQQSAAAAKAVTAASTAAANPTPQNLYLSANASAFQQWISGVSPAFVTHATNRAIADGNLAHSLAVRRATRDIAIADADKQLSFALADQEKIGATDAVARENTKNESLTAAESARATDFDTHFSSLRSDKHLAEKQETLDLISAYHQVLTDRLHLPSPQPDDLYALEQARIAHEYADAQTNAYHQFQQDELISQKTYTTDANAAQTAYLRGFAADVEAQETAVADAIKLRDTAAITAQSNFQIGQATDRNVYRSAVGIADANLWITEEQQRVTAHTSIDTQLQTPWSEYLVDSAQARLDWWTVAQPIYLQLQTDRNILELGYATSLAGLVTTRDGTIRDARHQQAIDKAAAERQNSLAQADALDAFFTNLKPSAEQYVSDEADSLQTYELALAQAARDYSVHQDGLQYTADRQAALDIFEQSQEAHQDAWNPVEIAEQINKLNSQALAAYNRSTDITAAELAFDQARINAQQAYRDQSSALYAQSAYNHANIDVIYRQYEANSLATQANNLAATTVTPWALYDAARLTDEAANVASTAADHFIRVQAQAGHQAAAEIAASSADAGWKHANAAGRAAEADKNSLANKNAANQNAASLQTLYATGLYEPPLPLVSQLDYWSSFSFGAIDFDQDFRVTSHDPQLSLSKETFSPWASGDHIELRPHLHNVDWVGMSASVNQIWSHYEPTTHDLTFTPILFLPGIQWYPDLPIYNPYAWRTFEDDSAVSTLQRLRDYDAVGGPAYTRTETVIDDFDAYQSSTWLFTDNDDAVGEALSQAAITVTNTVSNWATWSADTVRSQIDGFASEVWSTVGNLVQSFVPARPELRAPDASEQREAAMRSVIDEDTLRPAHEDQFFVQLPGEVDSQLASEYISAALSLAGGIETADEAGTDELHATLRRLYRERSADATLQERPRQQPASETLQFQEYRDSLANPDAWPTLTAAQREAAATVSWWWPIQLTTVGADRVWLKIFEKLGQKARQKQLDVYAALEKLGTMATENPTDEDIVAITDQIAQVQQLHEEYIDQLIKIEKSIAEYHDKNWVSGTWVQETMRKLGQLAPVIELLKADFAPSNLDAYNKARLQHAKAMSGLDSRTGTTITSLYVIDGAATLASLAIPGYGAVKTAAVEAGKKGGKWAAWKAGIAVAGKQVVVTGAAVGATVIVLPPAMRASGLEEHQIVAGMAVLQVFGITRSLKYVNVTPFDDTARFAQRDYGEVFSSKGIKIYSELAGRRIVTIDDLVDAIRSGAIDPSKIPIDVIRRGKTILILNTRSSEALRRAGIPRKQWNTIDRTNNPLFERLLYDQLHRNYLDDFGIPDPRSQGLGL